MAELKPLDEITQDASVGIGDLILLRMTHEAVTGPSTLDRFVLYAGPASFAAHGDEGTSGEPIQGIRVFVGRANGKPHGTKRGTSYYHDYRLGDFIPKDMQPQTFYYALLAKADTLPE